jgi:hypothetical protein
LRFIPVLFDAVAFVEFVDPASSRNKFLLTCIEGVAIRASVDFDVFRSRAGLECVPASATRYGDPMILRVNVLFHFVFLLLP